MQNRYQMPKHDRAAFEIVMNCLRAADAAKETYTNEPTRMNYLKLVFAQRRAIAAMESDKW